MHQRHRQTDDRQTDGSAIAYSEGEREFTSAKKGADSRDKVNHNGKSDQLFLERMMKVAEQE